MSGAAHAAPRRWRPPPLIKGPLLRWVFIVGAGVYLAVALGMLDVNWSRLAQGGPRAVRLLGGFIPPDFISRGDAILQGVLESI